MDLFFFFGKKRKKNQRHANTHKRTGAAKAMTHLEAKILYLKSGSESAEKMGPKSVDKPGPLIHVFETSLKRSFQK